MFRAGKSVFSIIVRVKGFSVFTSFDGWSASGTTGGSPYRRAASGRRKEMLREEVFQKATDGRPYSCFAEHYGQEYSECDAGKERAKQIAGRFFSGRRGVCFIAGGSYRGRRRKGFADRYGLRGCPIAAAAGKSGLSAAMYAVPLGRLYR